MKGKYIAPFLDGEAFNCVSCHVYTKQHWYYLRGSSGADGYGDQTNDPRFRISYCEHCRFPTIWHGESVIFPLNMSVEPPNDDLPDDIKRDYEEASCIFNLSPRGAAALLRLGIQKLCAHLGQSGKNINTDIKELVAAGLPPRVQEALDSVRVIGNDAVHPGKIDLNDDRDTASQLFRLVNFIAQKMITEPREIDDIYSNLPAEKLQGIKDRDGDQ